MKYYIDIEHNEQLGVCDIQEFYYDYSMDFDESITLEELKVHTPVFIQQSRKEVQKLTGNNSGDLLKNELFIQDIIRAYTTAKRDLYLINVFDTLKACFIQTNFEEELGISMDETYYVNDNCKPCEFYEAAQVCIEFNERVLLDNPEFLEAFKYEGEHYKNKQEYATYYIESFVITHEQPDFNYWRHDHATPEDADCFALFKEYNETTYVYFRALKSWLKKLKGMIKNHVSLSKRVSIYNKSEFAAMQ